LIRVGLRPDYLLFQRLLFCSEALSNNFWERKQKSSQESNIRVSKGFGTFCWILSALASFFISKKAKVWRVIVGAGDNQGFRSSYSTSFAFSGTHL
jgi:hypothetical protein